MIQSLAMACCIEGATERKAVKKKPLFVNKKKQKNFSNLDLSS
jgi:hypothetical protein